MTLVVKVAVIPGAEVLSVFAVLASIKSAVMNLSSIAYTPPMRANEYDALPLPGDWWANGPVDLNSLTDDEIMSIPPHIIVHIKRTNAQNGLQVISPRQIPSTYIVKRTDTNSRATFVHLAGSDASRAAKWPVPKGSTPPDESWFEDEPMAKLGPPLAERTPATVSPLAHVGADIVNPIHRAWIKARAMVDLQLADGVGGDAEGLADALERRFGAPKGSLMSDPGMVATVAKDLKQHAIVTDNTLARQLAPIQARRVVAVAVSASSAEAFGPHRAFDWTAARVTAGNKFSLTASNEGHSLKALSVASICPVGEQLQKPDNRSKAVMAYHPTPGTVWSYEPSTFALTVDRSKLTFKRPSNPVIEAVLKEGATFVSPIVSALAHESAVNWTRTAVAAGTSGSDFSNTSVFHGFYGRVSAAVTTQLSMGKTGHKALTNELYSAMSHAPVEESAKAVRAIVTLKEALDHMGTDASLSDEAISTMATRLVKMDSYLHAHMANCAAVRNEDVDQWFESMLPLAPTVARTTKAGSKGWAKLAISFLLKPPDERWVKLLSAVRASLIDRMETPFRVSFGDCADDPDLHMSAVTMKVKAVVSHRKIVHCASYDGAALGCAVAARIADAASLPSTALALRVTAAGWTLRQAFLRRVYVAMAHSADLRPGAYANSEFKPMPIEGSKSFRITTRVTPHRAYRDWRVKLGELLGEDRVIAPQEVRTGKIGYAIIMARTVAQLPGESRKCEKPVGESGTLGCMRYAADPSSLASALDSNVSMLHGDAVEAVNSYVADLEKLSKSRAEAARAAVAEVASRLAAALVPAPAPVKTDSSYVAPIDESIWAGESKPVSESQTDGWYWLTQVSVEDADYLTAKRGELEHFDSLMAMWYPDMDSFFAAFDDAEVAQAAVGSSDVLIG